MRGSHGWRSSACLGRGSIPAHAGEPRTAVVMRSDTRVYPRACGGARSRGWRGHPCGGLSPRMRGSRGATAAGACSGGSIPAHAGEPNRCIRTACHPWVYPRACGGAIEPGRPGRRIPGLSPRMRGSQMAQNANPCCAGSIPAHAGEPNSAKPTANRRRVYPRACGGAKSRRECILADTGLSPRMRGSPSGSG